MYTADSVIISPNCFMRVCVKGMTCLIWMIYLPVKKLHELIIDKKSITILTYGLSNKYCSIKQTDSL